MAIIQSCVRTFVLGLLSLALISCDSDDSKGSAGQLGGTLVVPTGTNQAKTAIMARALGAKADEDACPNVPEGYSPLANAEVAFIGGDGAQLGLADAPTDACGAFTGTLPAGTTQVRGTAPGFRDITTDVAVFQSGDANNNVASTIPNEATYTIGSIQKVDDDTIAFTVTDDQTNKAVLGIPDSALTATVNKSPANMTTSSAVATSGKASVVMTLDASPSMEESVFTDADSGKEFTRFQLASIAGHTFLDYKSAEDEVATVIYDGTVNFIDQAAVDQLFPLTDQNDVAVKHVFPADGFSAQAKDLRFIMDAYNPYAAWWGTSSSTDALHPDTPNYKQVKSYPWTSATAVYDSISTGVEKLAARSSLRKFIIAMTDGDDNSSNNTEDEVITLAKTNNMAVYTVGFGAGTYTNETSLQKIAAETGGTYFRAENTDISAAYQSIQTNITFQYLGDLDTSLGEKFQVEVFLNHNGITVSRELNTL